MDNRRTKTGIEGFDEMLGGGFVQGDAVMVAGGAGSGKTTLALEYLVNGAILYGEPGIYITFEQLPNQLYRDAKNFGWDLRKLEQQNKLRVICTSPNLFVEESAAAELLRDALSEIKPQRIVVDSLSHLNMFVKEEELRLVLYRTIMLFKTKGLSSLLLWEAPQTGGQSFTISDSGTSFLVDAIIMLRFVEIDSEIRNAVAVMKMRGSAHSRRLREYQISDTGIKMEAAFREYSGLMSGSPTKTASEKFLESFDFAVKGKKTN
jgi:circadian clock protein KaiC